MRKRILGSLAVVAAGTGLSFGQGPPPGAYPLPGQGPGVMMPQGGPQAGFAAPPDSGYMLRNGQAIIPPPVVGGNLSPAEFGPPGPGPDTGMDGGGGGRSGLGAWERSGPPSSWIGFDYLMWWAKNQSLIPLVTTGSAANGGLIGTPGTTVLLGRNSSVDYGTINGYRGWIGAYVDEERQVGFELGGFLMEKASVSERFQSSATGTPLLAVPFVNAATGAQGAYLVSTPAGQTGSIRFTTNEKTYSVEGNTLINLYRGDETAGNGIDFLCGPRFFSLEERLTLDTSTTNAAASTFTGLPVAAGSIINTNDRLRTFNEFIGMNVGFRGDHNYGRLYMGWTAKVAGGYMNSWTDARGYSSANTGGVTSFSPGGRFVEPADVGRHRDDFLAFIPEGGLNLGYQITPKVRIHVGYTYMFVNSVLRPGSILDRRVNAAALPTDPGFGTGPSRTYSHDLDHKSEYNLQGINFGMQFGF